MNKYDIFLSYRREGGFETAKMVQEKLKSLGYKVFLDFEDLRTGKFNEQLYTVISECNDFVVIMSPGCLDRCENTEDWLRLEVVHALENNRNIIPIMLRNFSWPDTMPAGMEELKYMNGLSASDEFFDAFIKRLVSHLKSNPSIIRKFKRLWIILALAITTISSFVFFYGRYESQRQLEQVSNAVIGDIGLKMTRLNVELDGVSEVSKKWAAYYQLMIMPGYEDYKKREKESLIQYINHREEQLIQVDYNSPVTDHYLDVLSKSKVPLEDVQAFYTTAYRLFFDEAAGYYTSIKNYVNMPVEGWLSQTPEMMQLREKMVYLNGEALYYNIIELVADMPESSRQVYNRFSAQLTSFPNVGRMTKDEARSAAEKSITIYQQSLNKFAAFTGQANIENTELEKDYERIALKQQEVDLITEEIDLVDSRIRQSKSEILKKCQPEPGDDQWMIWGKMLRLISVKMNKDALKLLDAYESMAGPEARIYTRPVRLFITTYMWKEYEGGVIAIGFKDDKPHSCLIPGDIIVAINSHPVRTVDELKATVNQEGKIATRMVLRIKDDNTFDKISLVFREDDPLTAFLNLTEIL
jgi:hypothetical protein